MLHRGGHLEKNNSYGKSRSFNQSTQQFGTDRAPCAPQQRVFHPGKNGFPIAGIMDIDDMEDWLELQDPEMQKQIAEGYKEYRQGRTRPLDEFLSEERY